MTSVLGFGTRGGNNQCPLDAFWMTLCKFAIVCRYIETVYSHDTSEPCDIWVAYSLTTNFSPLTASVMSIAFAIACRPCPTVLTGNGTL